MLKLTITSLSIALVALLTTYWLFGGVVEPVPANCTILYSDVIRPIICQYPEEELDCVQEMAVIVIYQFSQDQRQYNLEQKIASNDTYSQELLSRFIPGSTLPCFTYPDKARVHWKGLF
jgi:hypothetical protein